MSAFWAPITAKLVPDPPHTTTRSNGASASPPAWVFVSTWTPVLLK